MLLARHPGDVFINTFSWRNFDGNKWHADHAGAEHRTTREDLVWLAATYPGIVSSRVIDAKCGGDLLAPQHRAMGFRVAKEAVCAQRREYEQFTGTKYDVVFLARYDLGFEAPFDFPETIDQNTLYGGHNANQVRQGCDGEVFLYGAPHVVDACMTPAIPPELADKVEAMGFHGEKIMTAARKLRGYEYKGHDVPHFLYRSGGGFVRVER
jgi:hypothetical protein